MRGWLMSAGVIVATVCAAAAVVASDLTRAGQAAPQAHRVPARCASLVVTDWADDGRLQGRYRPVCYREAIRRLPEDLRAYSSAADDIHRALQQALIQR